MAPQKCGGKPSNVGLEDFEPLCVEGKSSFGKVMKVTKKDTGVTYAMQVMNNKDVIPAAKDILRRLSHRYIVKLHFVLQTEDKLYLIPDFLTGGSVFSHLQKEKKFTEGRARHFTAQIALAIDYMHSLGIIYEGLKLDDCVLDNEGNCYITDFGLAKPQEDDYYTLEYLAPELLTGEGRGKAVDWYALRTHMKETSTGGLWAYSFTR